MTERTCFNCGEGVMYAGQYGRYCFDCGTYLPTGDAAKLADRYFEANDAGDQTRVVELMAQLDECRRVTIATANGPPE
jgi:hypothetical protein